jgi:predicted ATPase
VGILQRELGTEPEPETRQLYQEVLRRNVSAGAPAEASVSQAREQPARSADRAVPELPAHDTVLVGREAELAELRGALEAVTWGRGRVALVVGEAGIGKTRLIAEVAALALARDARVLLGRCYESARILPFGPWVDALRTGHALAETEVLDGLSTVWRTELARLFPELAERRPADAAGAEDSLRLFEAMAQLVVALARARPLVLVLEDLHWADEMSLRFLSFLGHRVAGMPVFIVATAREEEVADAPALARTLAELRRESVTLDLALGRLSREATASLVGVLGRTNRDATALAELGDRVWRASDGNPFIAVETLRAFEQGTAATAGGLPLPERVRELVTQRLARLEPRARELATVAAVIGREFDFALLERAAGVGCIGRRSRRRRR